MAANSRLAVAIHVLTVLGYVKGKLLTSDALASSINTNPVVVRRIVSDLAAAGLVESRRGKSGGIKLARDPSEITLWDVYVALDSESPFCLPPKPANPDCPVGRRMSDMLNGVIADVDAAIEDRLRQTPLSDLVASVPA